MLNNKIYKIEIDKDIFVFFAIIIPINIVISFFWFDDFNSQWNMPLDSNYIKNHLSTFLLWDKAA